MSSTTTHTVRSGADRVGVKPPHIRELTVRSILCGFVVAAVMGASYPYVVLKLGFGPNVSVVAAFFGYLALGIAFRDFNRWENNIVQTAGTAAAQTAFMCIVLAAFDMLAERPGTTLTVVLTPFTSFLWLATAGILGVLLAVPMRQHFIVDEQLPFPDGVAAGETLIALDGEGPDARTAAWLLAGAAVASAVVMLMTEDARVLNWFPSVTSIGTAVMIRSGIGVNWSLLALGSGMLVGLRINLSMLLGVLIGWMAVPYMLLAAGIVQPTFNRNDILLWSMWPATGLLIASGLTSLALKWAVLKRTFSKLSARGDDRSFPLNWTLIGIGLSSVALIIVQRVVFGLDIWITAVAIVLSAVFMLVGLRVLGETNWGPISQLTNTMQAIFGALAPGNLTANMLASGTTGTVAVVSEALMQDYRAGHMIGSTPKYLTIMQLLATPIGAAAVSWMYPLLRSTYGIVGENAGLSSPTSRRIAGFAEILVQGFGALPRGALIALVVGAIVGVLIAILESRGVRWIPSATGVGIAMVVPAAVILVMVVGGVIEFLWRRSPRSYELYLPPTAAGFIAGEALVGVVIPLLVVLGLLTV